MASVWKSKTFYTLLWAACCAAGIQFKHSEKMNSIDFKTVDVRLLYWPLSGQAVAAADQQLQWKAILGVLSAQNPTAGHSSFLPLFHPSFPA